MKIITNNHYRAILSFFELSTKEQDELKDSYDTIQESSFFRYRGQVYDLGEFMRPCGYSYDDATISHEMKEWEGYHNDSFFSSILVKYSSCNDAVKVGLAIS
tara:strand:+ start:148 stop:453 length:306 start_codon:yes stop_codon:yes gene_type:complete